MKSDEGKLLWDITIQTDHVIEHRQPDVVFLGKQQGQGGAVASWLVCSTPDRVVRVRVLAGDIVLCSWARNFTLTVPLSTQVYKWVPPNLMLGGNPAMDWHLIKGGVEILLVASCYNNRT